MPRQTSHAEQLSVLTQNMALECGRMPNAEQRYNALGHFILTNSPNVVLLQEVDTQIGLPTLLDTLSEGQHDYELLPADVYPDSTGSKQLLMLSNIPVTDHRQVGPFAGKHRFQVAQIRYGGLPVEVANVHPETPILKEGIRYRKLSTLADYLLSLETEGTIIAGDFNSLATLMPTFRHLVSKGYVSAYKQVHGKLPDYTYPAVDATELVEGKYVTEKQHQLLRVAGRISSLLKRNRQELMRYTLDHVLISGKLSAQEADLVLPDKTEGMPLADHRGIVAYLTWLPTSAM